MPPQSAVKNAGKPTAAPAKRGGKSKAPETTVKKETAKLAAKGAGKGPGKAKAPKEPVVKPPKEPKPPKAPKAPAKPRVVKAPKEPVTQHLSGAMSIPCSITKFKNLINARGINAKLADEIGRLKTQIAEIDAKAAKDPKCDEVTKLSHKISEEVTKTNADGTPVLNDKGKEVTETVTKMVSERDFLVLQKKEKSAEKVRFEMNAVIGVAAFIDYMTHDMVNFAINETIKNGKSMLSSGLLYNTGVETLASYPFFSNTQAYLEGKPTPASEEASPAEEPKDTESESDLDNNNFKSFIGKIIHSIRYENKDNQAYINLKVKMEFKTLINSIIIELLTQKFSSILRELVTSTKEKDDLVITKTKTVTYQTVMTMIRVIAIHGRVGYTDMVNEITRKYHIGVAYNENSKQQKETRKAQQPESTEAKTEAPADESKKKAKAK